ncbi:2,3-dihydroxybenzoate-AMP ligase [Actinoplanes cyaneus]|uniref:2,3-dihydroxybenzoate-AMP ligase n=1 Tax=Actinoplanes cyaneus TaxID=52696 RepID=A0A919IGP2_9ACTN|nr:AMP-binding protein [Actinoplanes cyaneus]MCW2142548.1 2,3-dihydroxybenzoate-AMP ligase [Actinoplanes cyaneus]GID65354.1 2,3-dihydroxybenzoate-AMP ligase [Actinoplanes cyaneus]
MWPDDFAARYRARGYWTGQTLDHLVDPARSSFASRVAVVDGDRRITYRQLFDRAQRLAAGLHAQGVRAGDRVVVQLPNVAEYFEVIFALFRLGALPVFALPAHRSSEIGYFCSHTAAVAFITEHAELAPAAGDARVILVGDLAGVDGDPSVLPAGPQSSDVAFLQLSGGSTGLPKLIPRTHDDYLYSVRESATICGLTPDSVYLTALPVAHNFTMSSPGVLGVLHTGGRIVLAPRPDPATVFPLIERERVTITAVVPPLAHLWLDAVAGAAEKPDLSSLDVLQVGGAKLADAVAARVRPVLGCQLQQVFGMAEGLVNYTRLDDPDDVVLHTQGRPISPDDEVLIVDDDDRPVPDGTVGHLLTRGPYTIRGYWNAEEHNRTAFTGEGFYRTGDLVRRRPDGYLVVEGRAKDQINRGGEKIAAEEVENHLLTHPAVHDVAVVAVPDPYLGERTCAFVVARDGTAAPKLSEVRTYLRERGLAAYKIPDRVRVLDAFPVTGVGKVSRRELRAALRATAS